MVGEHSNGFRDEESAEPSQSHAQDVEMGARLIRPNSWSSDAPNQHISNVLGSALSETQKRRNRCYGRCADYPSPICNWPTIGLSVISLVLLSLLLRSHLNSSVPSTQNNLAPQTDTDAEASPEGRLQGNFSALQDYRGRLRVATGRRGAVATDHGRCSERGMRVLQDGGNAVDSAVATALCQGIYNPHASGIGGGAFIMIRMPNGSVEVVDGREVAPAGATTHMFTGKGADASLEGGLAVAVPLEVKALWLAHKSHGALPWRDLVLPAARDARSGFPAHPYLVSALNKDRPRLQNHIDMMKTFYIAEGDRWRVPRINETCCARPLLADTLEAVAALGPSALDKHASAMAAEIQAAGGIVTADDLTRNQPLVRQPLRAQVWGLEMLVPPPPSSGASIITALHILAGYETPLAFSGGLGSHRVVEAMKHAFALRQHLGDPGSCPAAAGLPCFLNTSTLLADMLSPAFADSLRHLVNDTVTSDTGVYGGQWHVDAAAPDDHGTCHLSVVEASGMAVSMTTTINAAWGSRVMSSSTGILFNNQMDDFSLPDRPNTYGVEPSQANFIQPGRKPLSSMSPAMVLGPQGALRIVLGASGGPRIISSMLQVLLRLIAWGDSAVSAIYAPRLHHQLLPNLLRAEDWTSGNLSLHTANSTLQALRQRGHNVRGATWSGVCQAVILSESGGMTGVSDPRKDGAPAAL